MGLINYILKRFLLSILMIFILLTMVFIVLRVVPGDPAVALLPSETPQKVLDEYRKKLGLDKPIHIQYLDYLSNILSGKWGESWAFGVAVVPIIFSRLPMTVELTIGAMFIGILMGVLSGLFSAINKESALDHFIRVITVGGYALPTFWLGLMLQLIFAVYLGILPTGGRYGILLMPKRITGFVIIDSIITFDLPLLISSLKHLVLPCLSLGVYSASILCRVTRAETLEQTGKNYILLLKSKGLSIEKIFRKHAFRNALLPVITFVGLEMAFMLGGTVITESIFNLPGIGRLLIQAFLERDYPLIQGILVLNGFLIAAVTLSMDILYSIIDPRIRY